MAALGEVTIKVKPDLSALQQAENEDVVDVLVEHLDHHLPKHMGRADLRVVAADLLERFHILPKVA